MPLFGLGTYQARPGKETKQAVLYALEIGYRLIDTAAMYENEEDVGEAVRESGIPREEIFVTTKLWNADHGYDRAIGVSNYMIRHLKELMKNSSTIPTVNQVEFNPYLYLRDLHEFCSSHKIVLESYSPLTKGYKLSDPKLKAIASKYSKTPAQILIRWALQKAVVVIPKSSKKKRILENATVFDFEITPEDMKLLDSFNQNLRTSWDPSTVP